MRVGEIIQKFEATFKGLKPLSSSTLTQKGKYYVLEGVAKGQNQVFEADFKVLVAFYSLNKDIAAGSEYLDLELEEIEKAQAPDAQTRIVFESLKLSSINEGLFVYEIALKMKVSE
ncbi:hypothetical protein BKH41_02800 [Helicobacter sp. 12S02232-10]|uniref:hypothetical protein n=1 Tax=Helicobacter sp. 12S02232-10 TaxID=1476197 RepID=UPI000BA7DCD5|nr:hypothetical protein [Helicobacter sp. 12S02232-10]PAF49609.1 hypothetical protein BKH41_02800 [Helicobacter sp. 12S02232-10]